MLGKLLKYDLKWIYKVIVVFYVLSLIFSLLTRLFLINDSFVFNILNKISAGIAISMIVSCLINCLMRSWVRFIRNIYKDESYLTHTLPVAKKDIYLSKVLSALITSFTTILVAVVCLFICYYSKENLEFLKTSLEFTANTLDTTIIKLILVISLVFFLEIVLVLLIGYVGIIIGHKSNKNRMAKTIIISVISYLLTQGIILILIYLFGYIDIDVLEVFKSSVISVTAIKKVMILGIVIYLVFNIIYYFIGKKQLEQGVNVF